MSDFQQSRTNLEAGRTASENARQELFVSGQRLKLLEKERTALERQKGDNHADYQQRRKELDKQIAAEKTKRTQLQQAYTGARAQLAGFEKTFELFIDPRKELQEHFACDTPFLLFPLRIETRFKTSGNQPQLWVRVYPDECLVDSFEPLLSRREVNNAAYFWAAYYSSGKPADPANPDAATIDQQKAAWRLLVNAHGDGRAAWITRQLVPDQAGSVFPVRGVNTFILVIATENWDATQQDIITGLLKQLWLADGNDTLVTQAKTAFNTANPTLDADAIIRTYGPVNFTEKLPLGLTKATANLQFAIVLFPGLEAKTGKEHAWTQPTKVNLLPERLAVIRYKGDTAMEPVFGNTIPYPLHTSPDPSTGADDQLVQNAQHDLEFAEEIKWVADFDRAVAIGMGFRINLAPDEVNGFSRLLVVGVKLSADAEGGKAQLQDLLNHHYFTKKGLSLLPQGMPTNNTGSADSGVTSNDTPDQTFDLYFKQKPGFTETATPAQKKDGQWLSEWLGLDYDLFKKVLNSDGNDQRDAFNMNLALWPATMGYVMKSVIENGFSEDTISYTRDFFNSFVSGRGPVPAIRIGNQPYGILPVTPFRRLTWTSEKNNNLQAANNNAYPAFISNLYRLLVKMDIYWASHLQGSVAQVTSQQGQPYQTLLDVIGLHPNSVEFHRRYMQSLTSVVNAMSLVKAGFRDQSNLDNYFMQTFNQEMQYNGVRMPAMLTMLGLPWQKPVKYLVDDVPLSEITPIRSYTADNRNYIKALIDQVHQSHNALRTGAGLTKRPDAELYRLLKYALELGYHESSLAAAVSVNAVPAARLATLRAEQPYIHQQWKGALTESRYALLYETMPQLSPVKNISEFVRDSLQLPLIPFYSRYLAGQLQALEQLKDASTARLERALVEHVDCCSYRLDAWKTGMLTLGMSRLRNNGADTPPAQRRTGIYLGAYGWLENVRPEKNKVLTNKEVPADLVGEFNPDGKKTFLTDAANEGYIHAPSLNQGVTAAVLRNGYLSHGKPDGSNVLAVNLTSERIRLALSVIEGIQGGQSLAALLGYRLERALHDREDLKAKSIDSYIYQLRKFFPLSANQIKETNTANNTDPSVDAATIPVTAIEARNVIHGVNLCNHVKKQTTAAGKKYPFGLALPATEAVIADAITTAVNGIMDVADAVADLGMAESVHQVVLGNYNRAAGVLDAYSKGNYPQQPDVIRTPRSGVTLNHRVGIPFTYIATAAGGTPRAQSEPSVNQWLTTMLPPLNQVVCNCSYISRATGATVPTTVSLQQLGIQPIDLLYILPATDTRSLSEIDDRLTHYLFTTADPRLDSTITISYTEAPATPGTLSLFQLIPLVKSLRALLVGTASLTPADLALPNEASKKDMPPAELPAQRVQDLKTGLKNLVQAATTAGGVISYLRALPDRATATEADITAIRNQAATTITRFAALLAGLGNYGIPQTGTGALYTRVQQWFTSIKDKLRAFRNRWQQQVDEYNTLAAGDTTLLKTLQAMERLVSVKPTPPETITLADVEVKKLLFDAAFVKLKNAIDNNQDTITTLLTDVQALNLADYDVIALDMDAELRGIPMFIYELQARAKALTDDLETQRIPQVEAVLSALAAVPAADKATQLQNAARLILGDDFTMVPRYALPAAQQAEINNSWNATGTLLDYSITTGKRTNPQEDWLHGIARVHEKMKHLENCILLREAFGGNEDDLYIHPVQLPFKTEKYHWLALPFPEADTNLEESNILLYTAFTATTTSAPTEVCGILADEWTELIPAREETTGITFHYDRPDSEAPQTLLLVTPPQFTGNWQWDDLTDSLLYALDAARSRGVEPAHIDNTFLAGLLPAVIGAESLYPYSIVLDNPVHYTTINQVNNNNTPIG